MRVCQIALNRENRIMKIMQKNQGLREGFKERVKGK